MNEQEFEEQLNALHDRVLSKALSDEEKNNYTESLFESIRHVNEYGQEFWYARDLQIALEYTEWRNFCKVIEKAKEACRGSNNAVSDHFVDVNKIVNASATSKDRENTLEQKCFEHWIKLVLARSSGLGVKMRNKRNRNIILAIFKNFCQSELLMCYHIGISPFGGLVFSF